MKPLLLRVVGGVAAGALRLTLILAILLRLTHVRDRFQFLAPLYYATPWPVIAGGFVVLAAHGWRRQRYHVMRRYLIFTAATLFTWVAVSWQSGARPAAEVDRATHIRVLQWNVARPLERFERVAGWIEKQDADVVALAETKQEGASFARWGQRFPQYDVYELPGDMALMVRNGSVRRVLAGLLDARSEFAVMEVAVKGRRFTLVQADVYGEPDWPRKTPLKNLTDLAFDLKDRPTLLVGDWNTPRESWHYERLRTVYTHAMEKHGQGMSESWPVPLPVLCIDQTWSSPSLPIARSELRWTPYSDHCAAITEIGE